MHAEFYEKVLYEIQDRALAEFRGSPFYLTGGTALSRGYYRHRYSEDLDLFVNDHPDFGRIAERQVDRLGARFPDITVALRDSNFLRLFVSENRLKIEMVNDVPAHIGALVAHPVLGALDSKENIVANKITALVDRALPKDVVDIFFLLSDGLSLRRALTDAGSKAAGIAPLLVAKLLSEFDYELLDAEIRWIREVRSAEIRGFMRDVSLRLVKGSPSA